MKAKSTICVFILGLSLINLFGADSCYANSPDNAERSLKTLDIEEPVKSWAEELAQKVDLEMWPESTVWRVAPIIDNLVTLTGIEADISRDFSFLRFKSGNMGGIGRWHCRQPKKDQTSSEKVIHGQILIVICVAENSRAAYEFLILERSKSTMSREVLAREFSRSNYIEGLGSIGFSGHVITMFVRDNIAVSIRSDGEFLKDSLALAREIDRLIKAKPIMTPEHFQSRRPVVSITPEVQRQAVSSSTERRSIDYNVFVPEGRKIAKVFAYIEEDSAGLLDGRRIYVAPEKKGLAAVSLYAITDELLVGKAEQLIDLDAGQVKPDTQ